jgi:hypothetical protein
MANPGKSYELPCKYMIDYSMGGPYLVFFEQVKIGGRNYRVNVYPVEIE